MREILLDKDHVLVPVEYGGWRIVYRPDPTRTNNLLRGEFSSAQQGREIFDKYKRGLLHRNSLGRFIPLTPRR